MWEVRLEKKAQKELNRIPLHNQEKILAILLTIARDPYLGKKLAGKFAGVYSYRVWPYRIIYKIYKKTLLIIIIRIAHRQGVYK